jgi:hypothetical protein
MGAEDTGGIELALMDTKPKGGGSMREPFESAAPVFTEGWGCAAPPAAVSTMRRPTKLLGRVCRSATSKEGGGCVSCELGGCATCMRTIGSGCRW